MTVRPATLPNVFGVLAEMLPTVTTIGYLHNPTVGVAEARIKAVEAAARAHNVQLVIENAGNPYEIEPAFKRLVAQNMGALVFGNSPLFIARTGQLVELAARYAVPAIYPYREQVEAGGLMSYGSSIFDAWRLAGIYAGRILKKERADNFSAQQSGKIELVINMRTAKALDLVVPTALVSRADHVI
ncbi:MAG TPA: ABC transporter substrate binding protein [Gemmataceae bacterium]|nr:ABC transporter substrate binding protein [Gemmataceae bacterium]